MLATNYWSQASQLNAGVIMKFPNALIATLHGNQNLKNDETGDVTGGRSQEGGAVVCSRPIKSVQYSLDPKTQHQMFFKYFYRISIIY